MSLIDGVPRARLGRPPVPVVVILPLIALLLLLAWLALFLFLRANESRIVFMTDRTHSSSVPTDATVFHRVEFPTSDGLSLEGIQLGTTAAWPYWILFCPASGMTIHMTEVQEPEPRVRLVGAALRCVMTRWRVVDVLDRRRGTARRRAAPAIAVDDVQNALRAAGPPTYADCRFCYSQILRSSDPQILRLEDPYRSVTGTI
jgi:hypothetical protein